MSSRSGELYQQVVTIKGDSDKAFKDALLELAECDADFSGDNGIDYLWDCADGFDSNAEYVADLVSKYKTKKKRAEKFVEKWMGEDDYYGAYEMSVIGPAKSPIAIALAYTT